MYQTTLRKNRVSLSLFLFAGFIFLLTSSPLFAQRIDVKGIITDDRNNPLPGVNIIVKGETGGAISDVEGKYSISVQSRDDILVFSFVGYEVAEELIGDRNIINVNLQPEYSELDEVVVIGYGTQKKSDLTGSVVKVSTDDIQEIPVVNVAEALKGRAAGVVVKNNTGAPGRGPEIRIRGESSLDAGNDPLVVIDGMPGGNLGSLNFNDVESFEVLKDASATSIYGAAGANGVILVTTKRGSAEKNEMFFSSKTGIRVFPDYHDLLSGEQLYDYLKEIDFVNSNPVSFSDEYYVNWDSIALSTVDTTQLYDINWQDQMFDVGNFQEYSLSFRGGKENLGYLLSGSYLTDEGIISPAQFDRYTIRLNIDHKINDRISISGNTFMSYSNRVSVNESGLGWNGGMVNASLQYPPFLPIYDEVTGYFFPNPIRPQVDSPRALADGQRNNSMNASLNGNFKLTAEIFKNFFYRAEFFARLNYGKGLSFRDRHNTYDGRVYNGIGHGSTNYSLNRTIHNMFEYKNSIGDHNVSFLAGNVYESSNSESLGVSVRDYSSDYIVLLQQANEREAITDGIGEWKQLAFLSRLNYAYRDKYLVQVNFRADGSPAFGPENRWGYFPSASIGWKISDEAFMDNYSQISLLKLRFGLGQTGNDQIGAWGWMATYGSGTRSKYPIYGNDSPVTFYGVSRYPNPFLKWEETFEYNLGIDLNAYRGRLDFGLDIYLRDSYDLLFNKPLPNTSGFGSTRANLGRVRNSGIETYLTTRNISTSDFLWKTSLNFSYNNNKVLDLGDSNEAIFSRWAVVEGYSIGEAYLYQVDRIFQEEDFIYDAEKDKYTLKEEFPTQPNAQPGDIKFKNNDDVDLDGDGEIDFMIGNEDRVFLGPSRPPITWGLTNSISYKGLGLEVFIMGVHGNYIFNETRVYSEGMEDYFNQFATVLDRWKSDNTDTQMPRASYSDPAGNNRDSDRFLEKGDFVRVKDITISYQFPDRLINSLRTQELSIFLTGQNWVTFTGYSGYDPEVSATDNGVYPQVKTLIFGLNVKF